MKRTIITVALLAISIFVPGCKQEQEYAEPEAFSFVVYPEARYLGELTEVTRQGHKLIKPNEEPPPIAIYDTDASVEQVANFYAKSYGYGTVAPDATNNLSATRPAAFFRTGDLGADAKSVEGMFAQLGLTTDVSKAVGSYKAADIEPRPNRPRVTVQRPYFNVKTSEVVDRTMILMARQ